MRTGGLHVGLGGSITAERVDLEDKDGVWLTIRGFAVEMRPLRLFSRELHIDHLTVTHATLVRMPVSSGGSGSLPLHVILDNGHVDRFDVDKAAVGQAVALSVDASGDLPSLDAGKFDLAARALEDGGAYHLAGSFDSKSMQVRVDANEPARGLIARIAGLHEADPAGDRRLGARAADIDGDEFLGHRRRSEGEQIRYRQPQRSQRRGATGRVVAGNDAGEQRLLSVGVAACASERLIRATARQRHAHHRRPGGAGRDGRAAGCTSEWRFFPRHRAGHADRRSTRPKKSRSCSRRPPSC